MTQGKITFKIGQSEVVKEGEFALDLFNSDIDYSVKEEGEEKIKITFAEPIVKEGTEYTGIFLPLDLAKDIKKIDFEPTTSK